MFLRSSEYVACDRVQAGENLRLDGYVSDIYGGLFSCFSNKKILCLKCGE